MEVVHIASQAIQIGTHIRQRCVWCGIELIDEDLRLVAFQTPPPGEPDPVFPTWPAGGLIGKDGGATWVVEHNEGDKLPETICAAPDTPPEPAEPEPARICISLGELGWRSVFHSDCPESRFGGIVGPDGSDEYTLDDGSPLSAWKCGHCNIRFFAGLDSEYRVIVVPRPEQGS